MKKTLQVRVFQWWHARGRCSHRSHLLGLWCWRPWNYQYRCAHHNGNWDCYEGYDC